MARHDLDVVSLAFGVIFAGLGAAFLLEALGTVDADLQMLPAVLLAATGAVLLITSFARRNRSEP